MCPPSRKKINKFKGGEGEVLEGGLDLEHFMAYTLPRNLSGTRHRSRRISLSFSLSPSPHTQARTHIHTHAQTYREKERERSGVTHTRTEGKSENVLASQRYKAVQEDVPPDFVGKCPTKLCWKMSHQTLLGIRSKCCTYDPSAKPRRTAVSERFQS